MFPQEFIDQVKDATNLVTLINNYTDLTHVGNGIWQGRCPHPKHLDDNPSLTVWEAKQSWACYGCHNGKKTKIDKTKKQTNTDKNYGTDCFAFLQWLTGISWKQAVLNLAKEADIPEPTDENQEVYNQKKMIAKAYQKSLRGEPFNYLVSRGLNKIDMEKWMIGFDGVKITFPLFDRYMNVLGFNKRWLHMPEDRADRYKNSPNNKIFNKSYYFYGIQNLDDGFEEIRITEGSMDTVLADKFGLKNIVATLGTSFTEGHVEIIKHLGKTPVFIYDGDAAGLKGIKKAIAALSKEGIFSKIVSLPNGIDLADLANDIQFDLEEYVLQNSITYGSYIVKDIISIYDSKVMEVKLKLLPQIVNLLEEIPGDERKIVSDYLKNRMQLDM